VCRTVWLFTSVRDSYDLQSHKCVCITTFQTDTKSNPNPNPTTKQHAIIIIVYYVIKTA